MARTGLVVTVVVCLLLWALGIFLIAFAFAGSYHFEEGKACWERGCDANGQNCDSAAAGRYCSAEFAAMVAVGCFCPLFGLMVLLCGCLFDRRPQRGNAVGASSSYDSVAAYNSGEPYTPDGGGGGWHTGHGMYHKNLVAVYNSAGQLIGWKAKPRLPPVRAPARAPDPRARDSTMALKWQDEDAYGRWRGDKAQELKPLPEPKIPEIAPGGSFSPGPAPLLAPPPPKAPPARRPEPEALQPFLPPPPPVREPEPPAPYEYAPGSPPRPERRDERNIFVLIHEYLKANRTRATELFRQMDKDTNRKLTVEELKKWVKKVLPDVADREIRHFMLMVDLDGDGAISASEFEKAMKESMFSHRAVRTADPSASGGEDVIGAADVLTRLDEYMTRNQAKAMELFKSFDKNGDKTLGAGEIKKLIKLVIPGMNNKELRYVLAHLEALDPNGDGTISFKELQAAVRAERAKNLASSSQHPDAGPPLYPGHY